MYALPDRQAGLHDEAKHGEQEFIDAEQAFREIENQHKEGDV